VSGKSLRKIIGFRSATEARFEARYFAALYDEEVLRSFIQALCENSATTIFGVLR